MINEKKFYSFYLEINKFELIFIVIEKNEINESKIIHKSSDKLKKQLVIKF